MSTIRPHDVETVDRAWRDRELPALSPLDRLALRLGIALLLWGRRNDRLVDRTALIERNRVARARAAALETHGRLQSRRLPGGQIL